MKEQEYYTVKDIAVALGVCKTTAYKEIYNMNQDLKKEYPNIRIFEHRIPIWYWDEKTKKINNNLNENTEEDM